MVTNYRFQLTMKPHVRDKMDAMAKARGISRSALITLLVNREWEEKGGKNSGHVMMDEVLE